MESRPNPSLPLEPPNTRVKSVDLGFARQNTEKPVSSGNIHSGKISQIKILLPISYGPFTYARTEENLRNERNVEHFQSLFIFVGLSRTPFLVERIQHGDQGKHNGIEHLRRIQEDRLADPIISKVRQCLHRTESTHAHLIRPAIP